MAKLVKCNKPIKKTIPQLYTRVIKSMEKDMYLICQLNEMGICCAGVSSKNSQVHLQKAQRRE